MSAPATPLCRNCDRPVLERFCGTCGQDREAHSRPIREILAEVVEHHFFLDSVTLHSLAALLFRPGRLTEAWIDGRRRAYASPFRLYVVASILFFLTLWSTHTALLQVRPDMVSRADAERYGLYLHLADDPAEKDDPTADDPNIPRPGLIIDFLQPARGSIAVPDRMARIVQNATGWRAELGAALTRSLTDPALLNQAADIWLPRVIILIVPLVAGIFAVLGGRRKLYFVDHLSFAMHLQAFILLITVPVILFCPAELRVPLQTVPLLLIAGYAVAAHRRVYGNAWWLSGLKTIAALTVYLVLLASTLIVVVLWSVAITA